MLYTGLIYNGAPTITKSVYSVVPDTRVAWRPNAFTQLEIWEGEGAPIITKGIMGTHLSVVLAADSDTRFM